MAKSKNNTAHNQSYKAHKNGIKKPRKHRHASTKGRVKVYRLKDDGKWDDQGTGHVTVDYLERSEELGLFVVDEEDNETLLMHRISSDDIYRKQEDTIISWSDPEYLTKLALSFQEPTGCSYIWDQINGVQLKPHTFSYSQEEVGDNETSVNLTEGDRREWSSAAHGDTQNSELNLASVREPHVTVDQRAAQSVGDSEQASQSVESCPSGAFITTFLGFHVNQQHLDLLESVRDAHPDTFSGLSYSTYIGGMLLDNFAVVLRTLCNTSVSQFGSCSLRTARASVTDFEKLGFKLEWLAPRIEQVYAQRKALNLKLEIEEKQKEIEEKQKEIEELHTLLGQRKSKLAFLVQEDQNLSEPALGRDDSILKGLFAL